MLSYETSSMYSSRAITMLCQAFSKEWHFALAQSTNLRFTHS